MLIVFEGVDRCGKTTQAQMLYRYLLSRNADAELFREPGGTEISEQIRNILKFGPANMYPLTQLLLFSAARHELIKRKIEPVLERGGIVILDRFWPSTYVYQGVLGGVSLRDAQLVTDMVVGDVHADVTFFIDVPASVALERDTRVGEDHMEQIFIDNAELAVMTYRNYASQRAWVEIDGTRGVDDVHDHVCHYLATLNHYVPHLNLNPKGVPDAVEHAEEGD